MRLLFAEDDRDLSNAVKALLERNGYMVDAVYDGISAVDYALTAQYDGLILDWMMPNMDGVSALGLIRKKGVNIPCLLLTARDAVEDKIAGLDAGADDYLPKPFNAQELLARIRAMLRRRDAYMPDVLAFEDITLDKSSMELKCGERSVRLIGKTYKLMELLMENPHILFSINQLMERLWGWDADAEINVVWVNISQLRKRLNELGSKVEIRVHRGSGYSLEKKA